MAAATQANLAWPQTSGRTVWSFVHRASTVVATTSIYRNATLMTHFAGKVWTEQRSLLIGASVFTASSGTLEQLYILHRALDAWEVERIATALLVA